MKIRFVRGACFLACPLLSESMTTLAAAGGDYR
jgi:hypothetical protein